jgi:Ras-related protein Rab-11A
MCGFADLRHLRQVKTDTARELAEKEDLAFIETSALTKAGVETAFMRILEEIYRSIREQEVESGKAEAAEPEVKRGEVVTIDTGKPDAKKAGGCCK